MKIVRWVALGLGVVVVLALLGSLLTPRHPTVTRSIDVAAAPAAVFSLVSDLRRFNEWSPWFDRDPNANFTFTGPTDGVGQTFHWQSDAPKVGSGSMTVEQLDPNKKVDITVSSANQGTIETWFTVEPEGNGADVSTKVTWGFTTDLGFQPGRPLFGPDDRRRRRARLRAGARPPQGARREAGGAAGPGLARALV